jgi:glycerol-3-phosphate acyltransferase PlsY
MAPIFSLLVVGDGRLALFCIPAAALLISRHLTNIKKLMAGTESRVGKG